MMSNVFVYPFNISLCRVSTEKMIIPVDTDHFQDLPEISLTAHQKEYLRKNIQMFDTRLFDFKTEGKICHRICLVSNNSQDMLYSKIRRILLEDTSDEELDVSIGFIHLQEINGELTLMHEKGKFKKHLNDSENISSFIKWMIQEFFDDDGNKFQSDDVPSMLLNLIDCDHKEHHLEEKTYPASIIRVAMTLDIVPSQNSFVHYHQVFTLRKNALSVFIVEPPPSDDEGIMDMYCTPPPSL